MWVMVVSRSPYEHMVGKPNVKYVANMHGNEAVGRYGHLLLNLFDILCKKGSADLTLCKCCKTTAKDERGESFLGEKSGKRKKLK